MTKVYTFLLSGLLILLTNNLSAQSAQGCNGMRYSQNIFEDVVSTTVVYGSNTDGAGNNFDLQMEIFQPVGDTQEKRPLIIFSHGGAFLTGMRGDMNQNCIDFAKRGFVTATISYRLYPLAQLGIPDSIGMMDAAIKAMGDLKAAIRYFRQDEATENLYRIDQNYIVAAGYSAGAIMSVHVGYLDEDDPISPYVEDVLTDNGGITGNTGSAANQAYSSDVVAVLNFSGALHKKEWMDADEPPLASYHGTDDAVVPYNHGPANILGIDFMTLDGSGLLHQKADDLGIYNYHVSVPGAGHADAYDFPYEDYQVEFEAGGLEFLQNILCGFTSSTSNLNETDRAVFVYPNPANNEVYVEVSNPTKGYQVVLYDQLGNQLLQHNNQTDELFNLKRGTLVSGVYFVEVRFNDTTKAPVIKKVIFQ